MSKRAAARPGMRRLPSRRRTALALLLLLTGAAGLAGCAYTTLDGNQPRVNTDDRLGPFN